MLNRTDAIRRGLLASGTARLARFGAAGSPSAFSLKTEAMEVVYEFDFAPSEAVLYTSGPGPFHSRHFLLDFWRHAKDGIMFLLGQERDGRWRDPTHCKPNSYVNYVPRNRFDHNKPASTPKDSTAADAREGIDRLASRVALVELEPGMYELPPQVAFSGAPVVTVYAFRAPPVAATRKVIVRRPVLNTPLEQTIQFVAASARLSTTQPSKALDGLVKALKYFPELHITLEGNMDGPRTLSPALAGRGPAARAFQDAPFRMSSPDQSENYGSLGQFMDARAQTIKNYLVSKGIPARRISCRRGRVFPEQRTRRSVTIIFSNFSNH